MAIVSEKEFKAAVETAKANLERLEGLTIPKEPIKLAGACDLDASFDLPVVNRFDVRLSVENKDSNTFHRIKLYDEPSEPYGGLILPLGVRVNFLLVKEAENDAELFDDLCEQLAYEIEQGYKISTVFLRFIAGILREDIKRPKRKKKPNYTNKFVLCLTLAKVKAKHNLRLTRNDYPTSDIKRSVLDAVSQAMKERGKSCEYSTLKREIYPIYKSLRS